MLVYYGNRKAAQQQFTFCSFNSPARLNCKFAHIQWLCMYIGHDSKRLLIIICNLKRCTNAKFVVYRQMLKDDKKYASNRKQKTLQFHTFQFDECMTLSVSIYISREFFFSKMLAKNCIQFLLLFANQMVICCVNSCCGCCHSRLIVF